MTLCSTFDPYDQPDPCLFYAHFSVVLVDVTGYVNLCADVSKGLYDRVSLKTEIPWMGAFTVLTMDLDKLQMKFKKSMFLFIYVTFLHVYAISWNFIMIGQHVFSDFYSGLHPWQLLVILKCEV